MTRSCTSSSPGGLGLGRVLGLEPVFLALVKSPASGLHFATNEPKVYTRANEDVAILLVYQIPTKRGNLTTPLAGCFSMRLRN